MSQSISAGAAVADITPTDSQFLFGYPHVERYSTGVHDRLLSSALYFSDGKTQLMFISNDIIFVPKDMADRARKEIERATGVPAANIVTSATHTHSGPITVDYLSNQADPVVPKADAGYLDFMEKRIVEAGIGAYRAAEPAEVGLGIADGTGIGTNRRDPEGPSDLEVPVLLTRSQASGNYIAAMLVCCMHPTVLHEDSTLVSGDFPAMTREYLQKTVLSGAPVIHHTGPEGNQSPRHVTTGNTFEEAERIGTLLGKAVERVIPGIEFSETVPLAAQQRHVELVSRQFPSVADAELHLQKSIDTLETLRKNGAPHTEIRTAECDWFGAEETVTMAKAAVTGQLEAARKAVMPAEIQALTIGRWNFVTWPGEMFIEYDLAVRSESSDTFIIAVANGELQGYIVTREAADEGGYEASNALFAPESGDILVRHTLNMVLK